jgi:NADH-quinone oxidoreductase subunit A
MAQYLPILIFCLVAAAFPVVTLVVARLIRANNPDPVKLSTYECGVEPTGEARDRYSVNYYVIAVLFVVFDVEVIFLFPWAVRYLQLGLAGFVSMTTFLLILVVGYVYAWKKGALEWV